MRFSPAAASAFFVPSWMPRIRVGGGGGGGCKVSLQSQRFQQIISNANTTTTNNNIVRLASSSSSSSKVVVTRGRTPMNHSYWCSTTIVMGGSRRTASTTTATAMGSNDDGGNNNNNSNITTNDNSHHPNRLIASSLFPHPQQEGRDVGMAMQALIDCDCVCFDVDSTVIQEEGIDVLAAYLGRGEEVAALTRSAMEGGMKFQDALQARLNLLQPSKSQILNCLQHHPFALTKGITEVIQTLHQQNKHVYLVSGGFRIMIEPVAAQLQIPISNIVANQILFNDDDNDAYAGFDTNEPTSRDMGKPRALEMIQKTRGPYHTMVMIGDGATDAQAKPPAQTFIGYGGVIIRETVRQQADWFITDFADLLHILNNNKK